MQLKEKREQEEEAAARAAIRKAEAKAAAARGWYRNVDGDMSFSDLAGVNIGVTAGNDAL